jgi:hypothetical protein
MKGKINKETTAMKWNQIYLGVDNLICVLIARFCYYPSFTRPPGLFKVGKECLQSPLEHLYSLLELIGKNL